jgi:WD40 repeat protein
VPTIAPKEKRRGSRYDSDGSDDDDDFQESGRSGRSRAPPRRKKVPKDYRNPSLQIAEECEETYPTHYHLFAPPLAAVNAASPVSAAYRSDHGTPVMALALSHNGHIIASCSVVGTVALWDAMNGAQLNVLLDKNEECAEEFYCLSFTPDDLGVLAAGKLKKRDIWDLEEDDLQISLSCPIKIFDIVSGTVRHQLVGHREEVHGLKVIMFRGSPCVASCSQDGSVRKWVMDRSFGACVNSTEIYDEETDRILDMCFLPQCGNTYLAVASDDTIKIIDFEQEVVLQQFDELYSCHCDSISVVYPPAIGRAPGEVILLTHGVEYVNDDGITPESSNKAILHRLKYPAKGSAGDAFALEQIRVFSDDDLLSNVWPVHARSNNHYVFVPTQKGDIFVFNLATGEKIAVLRDHAEGDVVRDILFHPSEPMFYSTGGDGFILVYKYKE